MEITKLTTERLIIIASFPDDMSLDDVSYKLNDLQHSIKNWQENPKKVLILPEFEGVKFRIERVSLPDEILFKGMIE